MADPPYRPINSAGALAALANAIPFTEDNARVVDSLIIHNLNPYTGRSSIAYAQLRTILKAESLTPRDMFAFVKHHWGREWNVTGQKDQHEIVLIPH